MFLKTSYYMRKFFVFLKHIRKYTFQLHLKNNDSKIILPDAAQRQVLQDLEKGKKRIKKVFL